MGSGGSSNGTTTIRYADYIEDKHKVFLDLLETNVNTAIPLNPYTSVTDIEIDDAFFGSGYTISSFPSLYDMYGKFMAGLDIEVLFDQEFEDSTQGPIINNLVAAKQDLMNDEVAAAQTAFAVGQRDINSVMASSFVVGKSIIHSDGVKKMSDFDAELRYKMIPVAVDRWGKHLEWNKTVIGMYSEVMKFWFTTKPGIEDFNLTQQANKVLWPFKVLDFERAGLGALQGAMTQEQKSGNNIFSSILGIGATALMFAAFS